ncbi:hypothetical protein [Candidatus Nephthysia bennettiae]
MGDRLRAGGCSCLFGVDLAVAVEWMLGESGLRTPLASTGELRK